MLSIIHRYVFWELVRSFVFSFAALIAVMLLAAIYKPLRVGVSLEDLARLIPYLLPHLYTWVIPAGCLSACVMTYGRLAADNELKALCANGIPLRYVCYPALVVAILLTALAIPLNDWLIPYSSLLKEQELRRMFLKEPFRVSLLGTDLITKVGNYKIYIESVEGNTLRNLVVVEPREPARPPGPKAPTGDAEKEALKPPPKRSQPEEEGSEVNIYRAERATYTVDADHRKLRIALHKGQMVMVIPGRSARSWIAIEAGEQVKEIPLADLDVTFERTPQMTTHQLLLRAAELRSELARRGDSLKRADAAAVQKRRVRYITEVRLREALAFATLALAFVGVPLGMVMRRQSRLASFAASILVFLVLYALIVGGEGLALDQRLPPWVALWTPDLLMGGLGFGLLLRVFRN